MKTVNELKQQLRKPGTLVEVLRPDGFADEGQVAATIAREHKKDLKPNQTRRIFHTFKEIDRGARRLDPEEALSEEDRMRLTMLSPELAYAVGRDLIPREFYEVLKLCLQKDKLQTVGDLRRLVSFLSAILAYQKFYE
jgi:CRISPR-associated protein Csm2